MADIKQISVSVPIHQGQDTSAGVSIQTNLSTPSLTATVANPVIVANADVPVVVGKQSDATVASGIPSAAALNTTVKDTSLNVVVTNMGEESVPDPRLFKFLSDTYGYSDQLIKSVFKVLADQSTTQDRLIAAVSKVLADATTTQETITKVIDFVRILTDATTNSEQLQAAVGKVLADAFTKQDQLSADVSKVLADTATIADLGYAVFLVGKSLQDNISLSDVLTTLVTFNRTFTDAVYTTDDFDGNATTEDDQYADVYKALIDWAVTSEQFAVDFEKGTVYELVGTIRDEVSLGPELPKTEFIAPDDYQYFTVGKNPQEITNTQERIAKDISKPAADDLASIYEQFTKLINVNIDESDYFVEDYVAEDYSIVAVHAQDTLVDLTFGKNIQDWVDATDDVDGAASIEDDQYAAIGKTLVEYATTTDTFARTVSYIRDYYDAASISEQLSVIAQTYYLDAITTQERVNFSAAKVLVDVATQQDQAQLATNISKLDQVTQQDEQYIDSTKVVEDWVDATDDFDGAATIEDDQYAEVGKTASDYGTIVETFDRTVDFNRTLLDTASLTNRNLIAYSEQFDDASWGKQSGITVTANAITAPDGELTADQIIDGGGGGGYLTKAAISYISGNSYTWSCYFKAGTATSAVILVYNTNFGAGANNISTTFNLSSGTVTSSRAAASGIESIGDGWYRCWQSHPCEISHTTGHQLVRMNTVSGTFYAWGYQVEVGSVPSPYQPATTALPILESATLTIDLVKSDQVNNQETISIDSTIEKSELIINADIVNIAAEKPVLETVVNADTSNIDVAKPVLETVANAEVIRADTTKPVLETAISTEAISLATDTARTETVVNTETVSLATDKPATETVTNTDLSTLETGKNPQDTVSNAEVIRADTAKLVLETAVSTEAISLATDTSRTETVVNTEAVSLATAKPATETVTNADLSTIETGKNPQDTVASSEALNKDVTSAINELVDATDDFDGATTTEDDQYAAVDKTLSDYATTSEAFSTLNTFNRTVTEAQVLSEAIAKAVDKILSDSALTSEVFSTLSTFDRTVTESQVLSETIASAVNKTLLDSAAVSEVFSTLNTFNRTVTESQILSEVFAAVTNKALSDNTNSSDTVTLVGAISKTDNVSISETKTLAMQSYFLTNDYVEAGYVGEYYTY